MRLKKVKFGNDPTIHFVVGVDLNRVEIQLFNKNPKTMVNEMRIRKDYYIVSDDTILDEKVDNNFIKRSNLVIVDLLIDIYDEYIALKEIEDTIYNDQLDKMGYIEISEESEEDNYK